MQHLPAELPAFDPPPRSAPAARVKPAKNGKTLAVMKRIRQSGLPGTHRLVLFVIASYIGWTNRKDRPAGTCHPGVETIAEGAGLAPRSVNRILPQLVAAGWLSIEPRSVAGFKTSNRYRITPPA